MTWQLLCDEHGFTREHYSELKKFSPEVLHEIIVERACLGFCVNAFSQK